MQLQDYIPDQARLACYIADGIVTRRSHNLFPLDIYCYGKRATFDQVWDSVTCRTRGLIVHRETSKIVARPFEKFHNINTERFPETMESNLLAMPSDPVWTEKLDGSMGILYEFNDFGPYTGIATKGSFHSEHAEWATKKYQTGDRYPGMYVWPEGYTPVFEIVCESVQHHVVHYGEDKLALLALIHIETGVELHHEQVRQWAWTNGMECVERHEINFDLAKVDRPNTEGYIATWYRSLPSQVPLRVKIKHDEFLRLQKIHHHTTPKTIFKAAREDQVNEVREIISVADEHLAVQVETWWKTYTRAYGDAFVRASDLVAIAMRCCTTRKEFAEFFLRPVHKWASAICFKMIDQADHTKAIWDYVESTGIIQQQKYDEIEEEQ